MLFIEFFLSASYSHTSDTLVITPKYRFLC